MFGENVFDMHFDILDLPMLNIFIYLNVSGKILALLTYKLLPTTVTLD